MSCAAAVSAVAMVAGLVRRAAIASVLAAIGLVSSQAWADDPGSNRLHHIDKLLNASSAARSVQGSDDPEVAKLYAQAKALYAQAATAADQADDARHNALLDEAVKTMFKAVRMVGSPTRADKDRRDFANRRRSIEALVDAYVRVATEKGTAQKGGALQARTRAQLGEADGLLDEGDIEGAMAKLDEAYVQLRSVLGEMRDGETLVHTLSFESPAEEYRYELDRNETHRMLVNVLLAEKLKDAHTRTRVTPHLETAAGHRAVADEAAGRREFQKAIDLLDASTREYLKAIRMAGIYVPG